MVSCTMCKSALDMHVVSIVFHCVGSFYHIVYDIIILSTQNDNHITLFVDFSLCLIYVRKGC